MTRSTEDDLKSAVMAFKVHGSKAEAAKALRIPRTTLNHRLNQAELAGTEIPEHVYPPAKGRQEVELENGKILVGSDAHYWPGEPSTAHRAFVAFCKQFNPDIVVMNGDVCDFAGISRHPPIGWTSLPTPDQEINAAQERLNEIVVASGKAKRFWPLGNHDARLETFIASRASELKGLKGTSLIDHMPDWEPCWSVFINNRPGGLVVKHRYKGGIHATHNNTVMAGRSICTGHLHSQKVTPVSDYNGTRYGVDTGCLAETYAPAFQDYLEDNPRNWRSGFALFTFKDGVLLYPELISVVEPGVVQFRGELIEV